MPRSTARLNLLRWLALWALVVGSLLVSALPVGRASATEGGPAPLDLAAMTLVPPDVPEPGFALAGGGRVPLATAASRAVRARGVWRVDAAADLADALAAAGWRGGYDSRLAAFDPDVPDRVGATVRSAVAEYGDAGGAAAGFALLTGDDAPTAGRVLPGLIPLGDESRITRTFVPAPGGDRPARRLELTFRRGNLIGSVAVADFTGERAWGVAVVEGLAARLLVRIDAVRAGAAPGLGPRVLRDDRPDMPPPVSDGYDRLAGQTFPLFGVDPEDAADRERLYGAATDVYAYERFVTTGKVTGATPYYGVKLYRFPDTAAAAAWLEAAPEMLFDDPGSFLDLALVDEAATIGDASRTISYGFPASDAVNTRGYRVYARVGNLVARVQLDGEPEVPLLAVEAVARAQVACLEVPVCTEEPPLPTALPGATGPGGEGITGHG